MRSDRLFLFTVVFAGLACSAQAQYTSKSTSSSGYTTNRKTTTQQHAPSTSATFRPRPSATKETATPARRVITPAAKAAGSETDDDELPSFSAFEKSERKAAKNVVPEPKGEVWFYIADFSYENVTGNPDFMNCQWKVVVQNRTDSKIGRYTIDYKLLDEEFSYDVGGLDAGGSRVSSHGTYSPKCPGLGQVKPKVGVRNCDFGPLNKPEQCQKYLIVK